MDLVDIYERAAESVVTGDCFDSENQMARSLALLFMAEILKEDEDA
jgi:hypothetical protein